VSSLPPSKGHYVDYTSFTFAYATLATTTVQVASPNPVNSNPNDIPIDPLLLDMSYDLPSSPIQRSSPSIEPTLKRAKKSASPPPSQGTNTGTSTPLSIDPDLGPQSSAVPSTPYRSSPQSRTANSSPLSLDTPSGM
jgi:hypothetical protein